MLSVCFSWLCLQQKWQAGQLTIAHMGLSFLKGQTSQDGYVGDVNYLEPEVNGNVWKIARSFAVRQGIIKFVALWQTTNRNSLKASVVFNQGSGFLLASNNH